MLDITAINGERIVAGIHVRVEDGGARVTRFHIENPERTERLQDLLRIVDGDEESYPDFTVLRTALATRGLTMRELRTVNDPEAVARGLFGAADTVDQWDARSSSKREGAPTLSASAGA